MTRGSGSRSVTRNVYAQQASGLCTFRWKIFCCEGTANFLHIPKTGGTWFRELVHATGPNNHVYHLDNIDSNIMFILRDPIERFLSALRHVFQHHNGQELGSLTIDNCITEYRNHSHPNHHFFDTLSDTWLADFKQHEHKIMRVFDFSSLKDSVLQMMPYLEEEPIINTPLNVTNNNFIGIGPSFISDDNLKWMQDRFKKDIELYSYIRQQPYFARCKCGVIHASDSTCFIEGCKC